MIIQDFTANEVTNKIDEISFSWESPSNIALVKYWGKNHDQTPKNSSISFTLSNCTTKTSILFKRIDKTSENIGFDLIFDGKKNTSFRPKIVKFFSMIQEYCPYLKDYHLLISSSNSFPHMKVIILSMSTLCSTQHLASRAAS